MSIFELNFIYIIGGTVLSLYIIGKLNKKKSMFFETAMHDEKSKEWNNNYKINLKDISENNIKSLFKKLGARKVEIIGYTEAYNKGYKRPLFYIKKWIFFWN